MLFSIVCKFLKGSVKKIQVNLEEAAAMQDPELAIDPRRLVQLGIRRVDLQRRPELQALRGGAQQVDRIFLYLADFSHWHLPLGAIHPDHEVAEVEGKGIGNHMGHFPRHAVSAANLGLDLGLHLRRSLCQWSIF